MSKILEALEAMNKIIDVLSILDSNIAENSLANKVKLALEEYNTSVFITKQEAEENHYKQCQICKDKFEKTCWNCGIDKASSACFNPNGSFYSPCNHWIKKNLL